MCNNVELGLDEYFGDRELALKKSFVACVTILTIVIALCVDLISLRLLFEYYLIRLRMNS